MTISTRIRGELFTSQSDDEILNDLRETSPRVRLIRLPLSRPPGNVHSPYKKKKRVKTTTAMTTESMAVAGQETCEISHRHGLLWTTDEHDRFLQGLELYPSGPWKAIASYVGTRTPRQTMTHAQKYRQKIQRRYRKSSQQPVPVIATKIRDSAAFKQSPKAVDHPLDVDDQAASLQSNGLDKVELDELSAAFQAFLEVYGSALFPMDDGEQVNAFDYDFVRTV